MPRFLLAALLLLASGLARAATLESVDVSRDGGRFSAVIDTRLDADPQQALMLFADPARLPELNPAVRLAEVIERRDAQHWTLKTAVEMCVAFLCKTLRQTQDMTLTPLAPPARGGVLDAVVRPGSGNLRAGSAKWTFTPCGTGTCLRFESTIEPDFLVPPLIGTWLIRRALREQSETTAAALERLARPTDTEQP